MSEVVQLTNQIEAARQETDRLFRIVRAGRLVERPIPERHRLVFYRGHLEAFDWNLLQGALGLPAFREDFDRLFAFGIDPGEGDRPSDAASDWPSVAEIESYGRRARQAIDEAIPRANVDPVLLHVALEHRLMHAETFAYMLHDLPLDAKEPEPVPASPDASARARRAVEIPAGSATLGITRASGAFGWDNELEAHVVEVDAFEIDALPVTNGDYLAYVDAGGRPPGFWVRREGRWHLRTMFAEIPLPRTWPAWVRQADAAAYAAWSRRALPTEAEWHRAAFDAPDGERAFPWGDAPPDRTRGNFGSRFWDPTPVGAFPAGASARGVLDLVGNGWEWTSTPFAPFPGFERFAFYPGYSADFFDGAHFVLKGASPRTADRLVRRSFRNWFRAEYPHVYAKFRCVTR